VRAAATAGRADQPVAFAAPHLACSYDADPDSKLRPDHGGDHHDRDTDQPNRGADQPSRDVDQPSRNADYPVRDADTHHHQCVADHQAKRHHECLKLGDDVGQRDRGTDPHAEVESRRHAHEDGHEDDIGNGDAEGIDQHHCEAHPVTH
jgi:hypothetical protein